MFWKKKNYRKYLIFHQTNGENVFPKKFYKKIKYTLNNISIFKIRWDFNIIILSSNFEESSKQVMLVKNHKYRAIIIPLLVSDNLRLQG